MRPSPTSVRPVFPRTFAGTWLAAFSVLLTACQSSEPPPGDPLADEEYSRRSGLSSPHHPSTGPGSLSRPRDANEPRAFSGISAADTAGAQRRTFQCYDAGAWYKDGQRYRQGCLQCQCMAGSNHQRIDCRELRGCKQR